MVNQKKKRLEMQKSRGVLVKNGKRRWCSNTRAQRPSNVCITYWPNPPLYLTKKLIIKYGILELVVREEKRVMVEKWRKKE